MARSEKGRNVFFKKILKCQTERREGRAPKRGKEDRGGVGGDQARGAKGTGESRNCPISLPLLVSGHQSQPPLIYLCSGMGSSIRNKKQVSS